MANIRSMNGANAIVKVGDEVLGYATGVTVNEVFGLQRIDVLGEIDSRDIEPLGRVVSVQISFIRMIPNPSEGGGESGNKGGGAVSRKLLPSTVSGSRNVQNTQIVTEFFEKGFDLVIQDSAEFEDAGDPKPRYTIEGCRPSAQSFAISRGTLMGVNVACEALRIIEED